MRKGLRGIWVVASTAARADPWRAAAVLSLEITNQFGLVFVALWLKLLTDAVVHRDLRSALVASALLGGLAWGVQGLAAISGFNLRTVLEERTGLLMDTRLMELMAGVPGLEHHERADYLDEAELLRQQRHQLSQAVSAIVVNAGLLAQTAGTVALLASVHPALIALPLFAVPSLLAGGAAEQLRQRALDRTAEAVRRSSHLYELATSAGPAKELRVFDLGEELVERHQRTWREVDRVRTAAAVRGALLAAAGWLVFAAGYVGAIGLVVRQAVHHHASPGDVVLALTLAAQVNQQVTGVVSIVAWLLSSLRVVRRYLWLVDYAEQAGAAPADPAPVPSRLREGIRFEAVSFRYPGTDVDVLHDVDLVLPAGSTVALVGDNGAGKTTLVKLLCRFYEPSSGRILVDRIDLARIDVDEWRARLAAGFQDFARFELLAREAVGVGDVPRIADSAAVEEALTRAAASDVVATLSDGLETQLGKLFADGTELSGGQWQKLALGRALMRGGPLLLVLDEPTASLDAQTEHTLFERYAGGARRAAAASGAITLLVSHRFSTVRIADFIVVIDDGRVVESGSHDELMLADGLYAELYQLQARAYR